MLVQLEVSGRLELVCVRYEGWSPALNPKPLELQLLTDQMHMSQQKKSTRPAIQPHSAQDHNQALFIEI